MSEGNIVNLQMEKIIAADEIFDDKTHHCQVFKYEIEDDDIYLQLKEEDLKAISLNAKYRCYILSKTETLLCMGVVKERYQCEHGNMLKFHIQNGFYSTPEINESINRK